MKLIETDGGRREAGFENEYRDCSVRAVALATNTPYTEAHASLKSKGRKNRKGASTAQIESSLKDLTLELESIKTAVFTAPYGGVKYPTLADTLRNYSQGRYVVITTGHAQAVIDGTIHDLGSIAGPRSRVKRVFRVVPRQLHAVKPEITQDQINELWARLDKLEGKAAR